MNALFCWKESALFAVRLVNDIKSFDFGHIQKCPFWPIPLHFRNASAASVQNHLRGGRHLAPNSFP
jgi:hypothetical protein